MYAPAAACGRTFRKASWDMTASPVTLPLHWGHTTERGKKAGSHGRTITRQRQGQSQEGTQSVKTRPTAARRAERAARRHEAAARLRSHSRHPLGTRLANGHPSAISMRRENSPLEVSTLARGRPLACGTSVGRGARDNRVRRDAIAAVATQTADQYAHVAASPADTHLWLAARVHR
jgi:hypothetical protein